MSLEEVVLSSEGLANWLASKDVFLRTRYYTDIAQFKRVDLALDNVNAVSAFIHQVNLGQDADRALTLGINPTSKLKGI